MILLLVLLCLQLVTEGLGVEKKDSAQIFEKQKESYKTAFHKGKKPSIVQALNIADDGASFKSTMKITVESTGNVKEKMEQMYKNLPVYDAHVVVEENKDTGEFISFFGDFYDGIEQDVGDIKPTISKTKATEIAEKSAGDLSKHPLASVTLHIYIKGGKAHLSHHVVYDILEEKKHMIFEVDAKSGALLDKYNGYVTEAGLTGGIAGGVTGGIAGGFAG